jgi:Ca2+/Na+ antiporter
MAFALIFASIVCLTVFLNRWEVTRDHGVSFTVCAWIFLGILAVFGVLPRAINMRMHPAKFLLTFVPIVNLILLLRCLIYPEGYEPSRRVDKTGKIVALVIAILSVCGYAWIILHDLGMI